MAAGSALSHAVRQRLTLMHIELTEMLCCPEPHPEEFLVLATGEMSGRTVSYGVLGCPVCQREYEIVSGVVYFTGAGGADQGAIPSEETPVPGPGLPAPDVLQALLDLSGPGGCVVLLGSAARAGAGLAALMGGIHFVGVNPPADVGESPVLSLLRCEKAIPLRASMARGVVVGAELGSPEWLAEAARVLLRGRRLVVVSEEIEVPGVSRRATGQGVWVGEKK